jgi:hypothetical protein
MVALSSYVTQANIAQGGYTFWYGPANTAQPPATLALYGDPSTPWINAGSTKEGWKFGSTVDVTELNVEEQDPPVKRTKKRGFTFSATLAEATLPNLKLAIGGGSIATVAPITGGSPVPGYKEFTFTDAFDQIACLLDGPGPNGTIRRIYLPVADSAGTLDVALRRLAAYQEFGVNISALTLTGLTIRDITPS